MLTINEHIGSILFQVKVEPTDTHLATLIESYWRVNKLMFQQYKKWNPQDKLGRLSKKRIVERGKLIQQLGKNFHLDLKYDV